jgi:RHS repeat-associated protein
MPDSVMSDVADDGLSPHASYEQAEAVRLAALGWNENTSAEQATMANVTRHEFTGHEGLDNAGLWMVNMNGRIYIPSGSMFLSPDPFISDPGNTQSYNRYSYVNNNPLTLTDPSGFGSTTPTQPYGGDERGGSQSGNSGRSIVTGGFGEGSVQGMMGYDMNFPTDIGMGNNGSGPLTGSFSTGAFGMNGGYAGGKNTFPGNNSSSGGQSSKTGGGGPTYVYNADGSIKEIIGTAESTARRPSIGSYFNVGSWGGSSLPTRSSHRRRFLALRLTSTISPHPGVAYHPVNPS